MNPVKSMVKGLLGSLGYTVIRSEYLPPAEKVRTNAFTKQQQLLQQLGKQNVTIFDVGAHQGRTSRRYRELFPQAEIYSFEPFPESMSELRKLHAADPHVHPVQKAVGKEAGTKTFYVSEYTATNSLLPRPVAERRYYPRRAELNESIQVDVVTLDDFVATSDIPSVDILKFDIQGGELNALQGARKVLKEGGLSLIYTEMMFIPHYENAPLFHQLWSFLAEFGFSLFDVYELVRAKNGQLRYGDALFVSESLRKNVIDKSPDEP